MRLVLVVALGVAGCVGLPAPEGGVWRIVAASKWADGLGSGALPAGSLNGRLHHYLATKLPLLPRPFVQALEAEHFTCDQWGDYREGGTDRVLQSPYPITCWYVARGSLVDDQACQAGAAVMIRVRFQGPAPITDFELTQMSFHDPAAHGSGICAPL